VEVVEMNKKKSALRNTLRVFFSRGPVIKICTVIIALFLFAAIFAPVLTSYPPTEQHLADKMAPPGETYLLGADHLGRDLLTRLLYGARISLITSLLSSLVAMGVGTLMGMIAGYFPGVIGQVIMRITDAQLSLPPLIVSMTLATALGGGIFGVSIVIGITMIPTYVRMVNGLVISLKENDYVTAGRLIGQSRWKILFKHLLPNCFPSIIVLFTMNLGSAIMLEASLSFLGIGITAPTPAWGSMVSEGYRFLQKNPILAILPGLCVLLIVIAFNIVGDGLRDALDPRLRGKL